MDILREVLLNPEDVFSFWSHFLGGLVAVVLGLRLLSQSENFSVKVYVISLVTTLFASAVSHHGFGASDWSQDCFDKLDHAAIFLLIAGTYTPIVIYRLTKHGGGNYLKLMWVVAIVGIILKIVLPRWPDELSAITYVVVGLLCASEPRVLLRALNPTQIFLLGFGGATYIVGATLYAVRWPIIASGFGAHEIHHVCVLVAATCHYVVCRQLILGESQYSINNRLADIIAVRTNTRGATLG
jgi:hemolysin III